ncbi:MAG TPA: sigma-70 family RNA polymerase sigma factor [Isosphaeraceae bacterium]|jgi:RNA polymerase sigma-70 factor (ECF subfamily)
MTDDDPRLARALARRDRALWAAVYDRHVGAVFGVAYHLVGRDPAIAEDVNQEVWLLAIEQIDRFDPGRGGFRDWLLGIARHRALRRRRRDPVRPSDDGPSRPADAPAPPEALEVAERADMVRAALLCLKDDRRQVLLEKYAEGLSVAEIAARTGRTAKAVESLLSRAREQLRALLRPYFTNPTGGDPHAPSDARQAR